MVISCNSGCWIILKGWFMLGEILFDVVVIEVWEEVGVKGKLFDCCLGVYFYYKMCGGSRDLLCLVMVYLVKVKKFEVEYLEYD